MSQGCFADPGNTFNEQVPARKHGDQRQPDDLIIAPDDGADGLFQSYGACGSGRLNGTCGH
jgi:hypothetical protein